jgi:hypothetical protein
MLNKEIVKQYAVRKCPKLVFNMASDKGILRIFNKMLELGVDEDSLLDEVIADNGGDDAYAEKYDSIFEMLKLYPNLRAEFNKRLESKEAANKIQTIINKYKNYQEVSNLSRLAMVEEYGSGVYRADTFDLSVDGLELTDNDQIIANTKKLLANKEAKVILEGQVVVGKSTARWDILIRHDDGFELLEVKGTNNVNSSSLFGALKRDYLYDIAFQHYLYKKAGIPLTSVGLMHLNKGFTLNDDEISYPIDKQYLHDLFLVTNQIYIKEFNKKTRKKDKRLVDLSYYLDEEHYLDNNTNGKFSIQVIVPLLEALIDGEEPAIKFDYNCKSQQGCILLNDCHKNIDDNHLFTLTNNSSVGGNWKNTKRYLDEGLVNISEIPEEEVDLNYKLVKDDKTKKFLARMQINIAQGRSNGDHLIEIGSLKKILELQYHEKPLLFFDFETFNYPIPLVAEAGPWEQICTQYSMHVLTDDYDLSKHDFEKGSGGNISHFEFLGSPFHDQHQNPERKLIEKLISDFHSMGINYLDNKFKLVVYNKTFENTQFRRMALKYPEYQKFLYGCANNIIDLNDIFALGIWYHRKFNGRTSLKVTQPQLLKDPVIQSWYKELPFNINATLDYKSELVQNGGVALELYHTMLRMQAVGELDESLNNEIRKALLKYCKIDSWGTVVLYDLMEKVIKKSEQGKLDLNLDNMNKISYLPSLIIKPPFVD